MTITPLPARQARWRATARLCTVALAAVVASLTLVVGASTAPARAATLPPIILDRPPVFLTVWPAAPNLGESVAMTTTTNFDVGPTPYYIGIYDVTDRTWVCECGSGLSCSATVPSPAAPNQTKVYQGVVGYYHALPDSAGELGESDPTTVTWFFIH
jgi:hypothetical protein